MASDRPRDVLDERAQTLLRLLIDKYIRDGQPVGCGGWRTISHFVEDAGRGPGEGVAEDVAEIKRMFVSAQARRQGVGEALLVALEASAREGGMRRMILETGMAQPEAISLYTKMGYEKIQNYGYYRDEPECVSFGREL